MPVQTPHSDYTYRSSDWAKLRTFVEGARAVRLAGPTYLPKPTGWTDDEYNSYKLRAEVYGAVDRTIDGLDGAIFRKSPVVKVPKTEDEEITKDITLSGKTLTVWIREVVREVLTVGRFGVLVDVAGSNVKPGESTSPRTTGEARPYAVNYAAEDIYNWETETIDGVTKLTLVVLRESTLVATATDPFVKVKQYRFRVLRLVEGVYRVELWTEQTPQTPTEGVSQTGGQEKVYTKTADITPTRRGRTLDQIPFFFLSPSGQHASPEKPPLLDITDLCILHYMTSADYAHGLHWVGLPTPWVTGATDVSMKIGPSSAIVLPDKDAKVGMLEFTGAGLKEVKDRLEGLERKMAALGARILEEQKKDAESGEALKLRQGGDASVLAGISDAVSRGAEAILARILWWHGTDAKEPEVTVSLNMDFFAATMEPQLILALMQAQQAGLISKATFIFNLQRGEMLPEGRTIEEEREMADADAPPMPEATPPGGGGDKK